MPTYTDQPCVCCGEIVSWASYSHIRPRCDECRMLCNNMPNTPCKKAKF